MEDSFQANVNKQNLKIEHPNCLIEYVHITVRKSISICEEKNYQNYLMSWTQIRDFMQSIELNVMNLLL